MSGDTTCRGFMWLGQTFASCDECGQDIRVHDGMHHRTHDDPFTDGDSVVVPFDEFERMSPVFSVYVTATDGSGRKRYQPLSIDENGPGR